MSSAQPSDVYTHGHHDSVLRSHRWRTAQNSAAYLIPHLTPGLRLLDVGCGPGNITADLAGLVAPGDAIGIDREAGVLAEATAAASGRGVGNVRFAVGDVYALGYPDASFDVVHAHQVLQHLSDPVAALRQMRRVCRPGGLVAVRDSDYSAMTWFPLTQELDRWMEIYQAVAHGNSAEPDAGRRLLGWALEAGFAAEDVTPSASVWCFATPEDRGWWGGIWADRITDSPLAAMAQRRGLAPAEELAGIGAAWRSWATHPDAWFAVLHGELLCRA